MSSRRTGDALYGNIAGVPASDDRAWDMRPMSAGPHRRPTALEPLAPGMAGQARLDYQHKAVLDQVAPLYTCSAPADPGRRWSIASRPLRTTAPRMMFRWHAISCASRATDARLGKLIEDRQRGPWRDFLGDHQFGNHALPITRWSAADRRGCCLHHFEKLRQYGAGPSCQHPSPPPFLYPPPTLPPFPLFP